MKSFDQRCMEMIACFPAGRAGAGQIGAVIILNVQGCICWQGAIFREDAVSLLDGEKSLSIAAGMNDPKNPNFSQPYAVEDHVVVDGKGANVGA